MTQTPPDLVFIIPYRNRATQLNEWLTHMTPLLHQYSYEIFIIHQTDPRRFNRGAIKNIGFLEVKKKYPKTYKDITLVFNDVDTMQKYENQFNYLTRSGTAKHFFGFGYAFGGIFSITAGDFETIHGFPNFWSWGLEDNLIYERWVGKFGKNNIDYTDFVSVKNPNYKKDIKFRNDSFKGREVEVQIAYYIQSIRSQNKEEMKQRKPLSESIQSIRSYDANSVPIQSILPNTPNNSNINVRNISKINCGSTDNGVYEHRRNLKKIQVQKVLTVHQLMNFKK